MKYLITLLFALGLTYESEANGYYFLNGTYTTNANAYYNSGTNSAGATTNNFYVGAVPAQSNVFWYLSTLPGNLPAVNSVIATNGGTNAWAPVLPSAVFSIAGGAPPNWIGPYPNSLYGPANNVLLSFYPQLMTTNVGISSCSAVFAVCSFDGTYWVTNAITLTDTIPVNQLTPNAPTATNWQSGAWSYVALEQINNTTNTVNLTNIVVSACTKPGL